ncbi:MAG: redoxin domain-containing protein [Pirellulales bacterium]
MKRVILPLVCLTIVAGTCWADSKPAAEKSPLGQKVENFKLQDFRGTEHSLADFERSPVVVVAFLGTECPLAKLYAPRLAELAEEYADRGVTFLGVNANRQDALTEIAAQVRDAGIKFPMLKDAGNAVADKLGAQRTPEVFVLDKDRVVRYWGRIDDRSGIGYTRAKTEHDYLKDALDGLLAGKELETSSVASVGCLIGRTHKANDNVDVTYSQQIARIFQERCVECHRAGEIGPFALSSYEEAAGWADTIAEVVRDSRMPPWHADPKHGHFKNDRSMPAAEKELIYKWVAAGAPEGNPSDLPKPREFVTGWTLPQEPEFVLDIQEKPYRVPADGVVDYQYFVVDPKFTEDKWVKASQILPGAAPVVHHVLCFVQPPGEERRPFDENGLGFLGAYVPGFRATPFPEGMAKYVPAGSKLIFQMHYTPVGKDVEDLSKMGFVFAKPDELTHMVQTISTGNRGLAIPPHAADYQRESTMTAYKHDLNVLSYAPHMHVRGKAFSYEAIYPDGKREMLLDVPHYDFNWQTSYELAEPKKLPPGTRVHCVAHWDNSENNLANPNPDETVHWGDQTFEEMMLGFFDVAVPIDREKLLADGTVPKLEAQTNVADRAKELIANFDRDGDGLLKKEELPDRFQTVFGLLDGNKDGSIDVAEATTFIKMQGGRGRGGFGGGGRGRGGLGGDRNRDGNRDRDAARGDGDKPKRDDDKGDAEAAGGGN